ncbi:MAG: EAL domain-containing protein [Roseicyclus sp.]
MAAALTVLVLSLLFFFETRQSQRVGLSNALSFTAGEMGTELGERVRARLDAAYLLKEVVESHQGSAADLVPELAATLHTRSDELQALNWIDAAGVIRIVVPFEGNEAAMGLDLAAAEIPSQVLSNASSAKALRVSPPLDLAQGGRGFAAYLPVFRENSLVGYVNAVFRTEPLIGEIAERHLDGRFNIVVTDGDSTVWRASEPAVKGLPARQRVLQVGQRSWVVTVSPTAAGIAEFDSMVDEMVIVFGTIAALVLGGVTHFAAQAQARFLDREERYALAMKGASDGLFDWNAETGITYYSPRWYGMIGYEPGEFEPGLESFLSLLHPEDAARLREKRALGNFCDDVDEDEFRMRHKDGSWVSILSRAAVLRENGKIKRIVGTHVDITELRRQQEELEVAATTDELTGLRNRRGLTEELQRQAFKLGAKERVLILHVDLDLFKSINDSLGHVAGDRALQETARRLLSDPADFDIIARVGGDEFLLAKRFSGDDEKAVAIAGNTIMSLSEPLIYHGATCRMGATIGVAYLGGSDLRDAETSVKNADIALGAAKRRGRGTMLIFTEELHREAVHSAGLMAEIEKSIRGDDFVAYFQPQIDLRSGRITGFEALARWQHPERGLLSGGDFVPVAEEGNLIRSIDVIVLEQACDLATSLRDLGLRDATVSVNLSTSQLMNSELVTDMKAILRRHGTTPDQLRLEILESTLLSERTRCVAENVRRLSNLGFRLDLDDFGTGHAAIASLLKFPIARLKIDRSLITDIDRDPRKQSITRAIVDMANGLSIDVLAEGVETVAEASFLHDSGCQSLQGYFLSEPLPRSALREFLFREERQSA